MGQEKTFESSFSHWVPASHPLQKALEDWGAAVEKQSGGTIKYKVFPAQQLGKAFDHYDMARDGIADVAYVNPGYQPGRFPIIGAGELPFLMSDAKGGSVGLDAWYLHPRQLRFMQQPSDGPALALLHLGRQQRLEITDMGLTLPGSRLGQSGELAADRRHAQRLAVLANGLVLEILHHALPTQGVEISSVS